MLFEQTESYDSFWQSRDHNITIEVVNNVLEIADENIIGKSCTVQEIVLSQLSLSF